MFAITPSDRLRGDLDIPLFADCSPRELRRIDTLAAVVTLRAGRVLCRQGDIGRQCFVLLEGRVDVDMNGCCHTVGRGGLIGEIALLTPSGRHTATATALTDVTALVFTRTEFTQLMTGHPTVAHKVLHQATRRLLENVEALSAGV